MRRHCRCRQSFLGMGVEPRGRKMGGWISDIGWLVVTMPVPAVIIGEDLWHVKGKAREIPEVEEIKPSAGSAWRNDEFV